jgi:hypothetical protein
MTTKVLLLKADMICLVAEPLLESAPNFRVEANDPQPDPTSRQGTDQISYQFPLDSE